jgi:AraC family transcriptional regulator
MSLDLGITTSPSRPSPPDSHNRPQPMREHASFPPRLLRKVREHIEAHLDTRLTLDELSEMAGMSSSHFSRCFKNSARLTPHFYVMQQRLRKAESLLANSEFRLVEIALMTGFADQSHFTRRFYFAKGLTPSAFRSQQR